MRLPPAKAVRELKLIQTDIRRAIEGRLTVRKPIRKTRQTVTQGRQAKMHQDKTTGKLHIEK